MELEKDVWKSQGARASVSFQQAVRYVAGTASSGLGFLPIHTGLLRDPWFSFSLLRDKLLMSYRDGYGVSTCCKES